MALKAYYIDNNQEVQQQELDRLGVLHWRLDADNYENDEDLKRICQERGYTYKDFVRAYC